MQKEKGVDVEDYFPNQEIKGDYDKTLAVKCQNGTFVGKKDGNVVSYKGVPYAEPPILNLRFKPPVKASNSDKIYEAYYLGKAGFQTLCETEKSSFYKQGEDCLTLNIWVNASNTDSKKPVMVFIHGGAFEWGGTADPLYEGTNFIKDHSDVILVTINYRIGILGFINLSILEGGENYKESGNLGILDQICALEWVRDNISNFGGDPNNVTIFGESAGGTSVSILPLIKRTKGLFHHVIAQSGSNQFTSSIENSLKITKILIERTNAKSVDDLVKLSEKEMKKIIDKFPEEKYVFPVRDGVVLPKNIYEEFDTFDFNGIDFLLGTNKDEYRYWLEDLGGTEPYLAHEKELFEYHTSLFSEQDKKKVNEFMENLPDKEEIWKLTEFLNEYIFRIRTIAQAEKISKRGGNVFVYFWTFPSEKPQFGACHAVELSSIFNNLKNGIYTGGKVNETLAKTAQLMWINFAKNGNPSTTSIKWNKFNLNDRKTMFLGEEIKEENDNYPERNEKLIPIAKYDFN